MLVLVWGACQQVLVDDSSKETDDRMTSCSS